MRELNLVKTGHLEWRDQEEPRLLEPNRSGIEKHHDAVRA
jgi:hypothetical protein